LPLADLCGNATANSRLLLAVQDPKASVRLRAHDAYAGAPYGRLESVELSSAHHDCLTSPPHSPLSFSSSSHSTLHISLRFHRAATLIHFPSHPPFLLTPLSRPSALARGLALVTRAYSGAGLLCGLGLMTAALHTPGGSSHNTLYSALLPPRSALSLVPHPFTRPPPEIPSHTGALPLSQVHCAARRPSKLEAP
jgi:hypothetical protein